MSFWGRHTWPCQICVQDTRLLVKKETKNDPKVPMGKEIWKSWDEAKFTGFLSIRFSYTRMRFYSSQDEPVAGWYSKYLTSGILSNKDTLTGLNTCWEMLSVLQPLLVCYFLRFFKNNISKNDSALWFHSTVPLFKSLKMSLGKHDPHREAIKSPQGMDPAEVISSISAYPKASLGSFISNHEFGNS